MARNKNVNLDISSISLNYFKQYTPTTSVYDFKEHNIQVLCIL